MIDSDKKNFLLLISNVYAFYRQDISAFAGSVWWEAMKPYDFAAVSDAFNRHCINPDNGQFLPKPADVVRMLQGSSKDSALVAWSKVDKAIRSVGTYESVVFDDSLIHSVIADMGGWILLGNKKEDEWPFVKNEFENRYRGYSSRSITPEYKPVLVGLAEAQNEQVGFRSMKPRLIGDAKKATDVYMSGSVSHAPVVRLGDTAPVLKLVSA